MPITHSYQPVPFFGISGHFPHWFPRVFYLVSAASLWSDQRGKFIRRKYQDSHSRMFLDSGGFSFFSRSGDYPFTREQYLELISHYQPLLWASLDYPCEPETVRRSHRTNLDRIEATLDHLKFFREHDAFGMIPVIQGYTIDERLHCLREMAKRNLAKPYMAIGSLCVIRNIKRIDEIVYQLSVEASRLFPFDVSWHLLGVKLDYVSYSGRGWPWVASFDTAAWSIGLSHETKNAVGNGEKHFRFERYATKVSRVVAVNRQFPLCLNV